MIDLHDGSCKPFTIARLPGKEIAAEAWDVTNGTRIVAEQPLLGWRVVPFAYTEKGIQGAGGFRPAPRGESPFGEGINCLPPAECLVPEMLQGADTRRLNGPLPSWSHRAPHPECTCGYRIVHDVKDTVRFYHRHRNAFKDQLSVPPGTKKSVAVFAVRGGGLTCRSVEFLHFNDPRGTVRVQHVALEAIVLLESTDAHTAPMFEQLGFTAHVLEDLTKVHEASRCGNEYKVKRTRVTKKHTLRQTVDPGVDGGTHFTTSGEWGAHGAAGVMLKTKEQEPRYLLQQRAHNLTYGGTWSIPGGARHEFETPGEAAARELGEEMGVKRLDAFQVIGAVTLELQDWAYHSIIAECETKPRIRKNEEVAATAWLTEAQILDLATGGKCHPLFEAALPAIFRV